MQQMVPPLREQHPELKTGGKILLQLLLKTG